MIALWLSPTWPWCIGAFPFCSACPRGHFNNMRPIQTEPPFRVVTTQVLAACSRDLDINDEEHATLFKKGKLLDSIGFHRPLRHNFI